MDPKLIDAILKSPALSGIAPLLVLLILWIAREFIGFRKRHFEFKTQVKKAKEEDLRDTLRALKDSADKNTIATAELTGRMKDLSEAIWKIPKLTSDVQILGEKQRDMDKRLQSLQTDPSTT